MSTYKKLGYFEAKFDANEPCPTSFRYIIFSSQRTGSNYLCSRLINLKDAYGIPMEYLLPDAIHAFRKRLPHRPSSSNNPEKIKLADYIQLIEAARTTPDGCFGIKVQPWQLLPMAGNSPGRVVNFLKGFDRLIFMTRRDKLAQAVSGAIAQHTDTWFNFNEEPALEAADISPLFPEIANMLSRNIQEEGLILSVERQLADKPSMHVYYEDIEHDADAVFRTVTEFLGARDTASLSEETVIRNTKKPTGLLAAKVRNEFMEFIRGHDVTT